ncbi:MAG TPA: DUF58 domain-containing protein [Chloroflexia bacterium]|nr:DUF58 domain-containing protein [Chloroflexia bacterium]
MTTSIQNPGGGKNTAYTTLFDATFLKKLERLSIISRKLRAGRMKGERRSSKRGSSVEFADYRNYVPGDDLRRVDWNAYARLERLFLKLFQEEEDVTVHVLIDASKSMDWGDNAPVFGLGAPGTPAGAAGVDQNKLIYAKRTAAALGYIGLSGFDRVTVAAFHRGTMTRFAPVRGRGHAVNLLRFIAGLQPEGETDLDATLRAYAAHAHFPGICFILSDFFSSGGGTEGLAALQAAGHEIHVLHVLAPAEVHPELALLGDLRLRDSETGQTQEVSIDSGLLDLYAEKFASWQGALESFCRRRGINYLQITTDSPFDDLVLHYLRRRGVLS